MREAQSLKDKRRVVLSLKERIRQKFNVGVAEVDHLDLWQRSALGVVAVGAEKQPIEAALSHIVDFVRSSGRGADLLDYKIEFL